VQYGEPFVRDLLTQQQVVIMDNKRQMAELVIRKRYPIAVGMGTDTLPQFQQQGLGKNVHVVPGDDISGDVVMLLNKAPNPNAAKVYVNWLLGQKTQRRLAEVAELNSLRVDVKPGSPESALDLRRIERYLDVSDEEYVDARLKVRQLTKELLK
jgi:ABC-type Fe3+ transport system substrate-binding protein